MTLLSCVSMLCGVGNPRYYAPSILGVPHNQSQHEGCIILLIIMISKNNIYYYYYYY